MKKFSKGKPRILKHFQKKRKILKKCFKKSLSKKRFNLSVIMTPYNSSGYLIENNSSSSYSIEDDIDIRKYSVIQGNEFYSNLFKINEENEFFNLQIDSFDLSTAETNSEKVIK